MKTKNLFIAVALLVSLLSNAQVTNLTLNGCANGVTHTLTAQLANTYSIVLNNTDGTTAGWTVKVSGHYNPVYTSTNVLLFDPSNTVTNITGVMTIYSAVNSATIVVCSTTLAQINIGASVSGLGCGWKIMNIGTATGIANIAKVQNMGLNVYPNPSVDKVNISLNLGDEDKKVKIFLYSITGQLVFEDEFTTNALTVRELNVDNYARGTYILQVKEGDNVQTSKLILQ